MVFHADQQPRGFEVVNHALSSFKAIVAGVSAAILVEARNIIEQVDLRQVVALAGSVIVRVMSGRYFYRAGAELGIGQLVKNDPDLGRDLVAVQRAALL